MDFRVQHRNIRRVEFGAVARGDENPLHLTMCHILCHIEIMPEVNMRQLRDTRKLKAWLNQGKTVVLRERNHVLARIVPAVKVDQPISYPDFAARAKKVLGDRVIAGSALVIEERGRY